MLRRLAARGASALAWVPLAVLVHEQVVGVAPAGLLHSAAADGVVDARASHGLVATTATPSALSEQEQRRRRRRPLPLDTDAVDNRRWPSRGGAAGLVRSDEIVCVRRSAGLVGLGGCALRPGCLVVFRSPTAWGAEARFAIGRAVGLPGDLYSDAQGRLGFVGPGQVVVAPQDFDEAGATGGSRSSFGHFGFDYVFEGPGAEAALAAGTDTEARQASAPPPVGEARADGVGDGGRGSGGGSSRGGGSSSDFGLIPTSLVEGTAVAVCWPPSRARWLR